MASVNFPTNVGGDGSTVTDDSNAATGLGNGGFRTRLVPMFANIINVANWIFGQVTTAKQSASTASSAAQSAAASAASAVSAPGTSATSATSLTIGTGAQSLTIQSGKLLVVGMMVSIASTPSPGNAMFGNVTAYNGSTGALTVNISSVTGAGTFAAWTVALSGAAGPAGPATALPYLLVVDQKANGTQGGSAVAGFQTRTLNTVVTNTISGASLASNQITLPAGTYQVRAAAPAFASDGHKASLYSVTDSVDLVVGANSSSVSTASYAITTSQVVGQFSISSAKVVSLRHYTGSSKATNGLGYNLSTGQVETYSVVEITKVA